MLVLTRAVGEKILIGDDIVIVVTCIKGSKVRIAVTAPKDIAVDRAEVRASKNSGEKVN